MYYKIRPPGPPGPSSFVGVIVAIIIIYKTRPPPPYGKTLYI